MRKLILIAILGFTCLFGNVFTSNGSMTEQDYEDARKYCTRDIPFLITYGKTQKEILKVCKSTKSTEYYNSVNIVNICEDAKKIDTFYSIDLDTIVKSCNELGFKVKK